MADEFVLIDVENDAHDLAGDVVAALQVFYPDFQPADGNLETVLIDALSRITSEASTLLAVVGIEVFKEFGTSFLNLPPTPEANAIATATVTMVDDDGYTLEAGTLVSIKKTGDETFAFRVVSDVVVPNGSTASAAGEVTLQAVLPGEEYNFTSLEANMLDSADFVQSIEIVSEPAGGADEEADEDYILRLKGELRLLAPRPILPADFVTLMKRIDGVERAIAIDGWDPTDDSLDNERMLGGVALDADGEDVQPAVDAEIEAYVDALREVNFVFQMGDSTRTEIDVTTTVRCLPGFATADVDTAVTTALNTYLSPEFWGRTAASEWTNVDVVRFWEVVQVINAVQGVDYIESLTVEGGAVDVNLSGVVPLPEPGTINVTANAAV